MPAGRSRCRRSVKAAWNARIPRRTPAPRGSACCAPHEPLQARPWPASGPVWELPKRTALPGPCLVSGVGREAGPARWHQVPSTGSIPGAWARRRQVAGLLSTKARARPCHGLHPASRGSDPPFSLLTVLWQTPGGPLASFCGGPLGSLRNFTSSSS